MSIYKIKTSQLKNLLPLSLCSILEPRVNVCMLKQYLGKHFYPFQCILLKMRITLPGFNAEYSLIQRESYWSYSVRWQQTKNLSLSPQIGRWLPPPGCIPNCLCVQDSPQNPCPCCRNIWDIFGKRGQRSFQIVYSTDSGLAAVHRPLAPIGIFVLKQDELR